MRGYAVLAVLAVATCSWAGFVTKTVQLKNAASEDLAAAIEEGGLALPDGVAVCSPAPQVLKISGDEPAVEAAAKAIAQWDKTPLQIVVKCVIREGDRVVSAPIVRTLALKAATVTESQGPDTTYSLRVCPIGVKGVGVRLRVTLGTGKATYHIPFALDGEETIAVVVGRGDEAKLRVTDVKTKKVREMRVPSEWKQLAGRSYTISAEVAEGVLQSD